MVLLPAIAPLSLARVARDTPPLVAAIACPLVTAVLPACMLARMFAGRDEPFGSLEAYLVPFARIAVSGYVFLGLLLAATEYGAWLSDLRSSHPGPATRTLLLSATTVLIPSVAWGAAVAVLGCRAVVTMPRTSWIFHPFFDLAGSCLWLPAIAVAWLAFLLTALHHVRHFPERCRCGYDRCGLPGPCPECGAGPEAVE